MNYAFAGHAALMGSYHPEETHLDKWVEWLRNGYRVIDISSGSKANLYDLFQPEITCITAHPVGNLHSTVSDIHKSPPATMTNGAAA